MGCDIHAHLEVMIEGAWHHHSTPDIHRNYELFGRMAGVRAGGAIVEARGFPVDASIVTRLEYEHWDVDAHTPSWLTIEEFLPLIEEFSRVDPDQLAVAADFLEQHGMPAAHVLREEDHWHGRGLRSVFNDFAYEITGWVKFPDDRSPWIQAIRLVFWFDN